jgi:hypothetical protein
MKRQARLLHIVLLGAFALGLGAPAWAAKLAISRIYIEYNSSANDLGFHVSLDGQNWERLKIVNPAGTTIFEGAEPNLDEFPLEDLLARFPEGRYRFIGVTVGGAALTGTGTLSHAVPAGPSVSAEVNDDSVIIRWDPVTGPAEILPDEDVDIVGYQILVGSFQVTLPASATEVTLPPEFVESLAPGEHAYEVLAIEAGGNQTITEGTFETR